MTPINILDISPAVSERIGSDRKHLKRKSSNLEFDRSEAKLLPPNEEIYDPNHLTYQMTVIQEVLMKPEVQAMVENGITVQYLINNGASIEFSD